METIFPIITKKEMFSNNNRNCIRNNVRKFKILFLTFHLTFYIYIYIKFSNTVTFYPTKKKKKKTPLLFENLTNDVTSYLTSLLCKLSVSKYIGPCVARFYEKT